MPAALDKHSASNKRKCKCMDPGSGKQTEADQAPTSSCSSHLSDDTKLKKYLIVKVGPYTGLAY